MKILIAPDKFKGSLNAAEVCDAIKNGDYEIAAHGYRWIEYQDVKKSVEKKHMQLAIKTIKDIFGSRPLGWYTGRCSPNTRDLVFDDGNFMYDSDYSYLMINNLMMIIL